MTRTRPGLRFAALVCGLIALVATSLFAGGTARAGDALDLADLLRLDEVIEVLHDEGLEYGELLDQDMLDGQGGALWDEQVARIYSTGRMSDLVRMALLRGLDQDEIDQSTAFFASPRGQRILSLETSARRAMVEPEIEAMAFAEYAALAGSDDVRLALIGELIRANDLIERNVAGALNSSFHFMRGLADSGSSAMNDAEITADVWSQEDDTRTDTLEWMYGFMLLAYDPLSDADLEAYIAFSDTPAGQALNAALFDGFDAMYLAISHDLGVLVGRAMKSSDL